MPGGMATLWNTVEERNRTLVRNALVLFNAGEVDAYLELYDPELVFHGLPVGLPAGVEGVRGFYQGLAAAFEDAHFEVDYIIAARSRVVVRYTFRGLHRAGFLGRAATGRQIHASGATILRIKNNRCVERWSDLDVAGAIDRAAAIALVDDTPTVSMRRFEAA